ncbi:helix-turn-helix transcriptional regulator [Yersinia wautersii]|uniref:helix-turn-helix transcriptional regulator n=1 Tax=Yersinia wautersii TaxID=1341643 RepID=UPI0004065424|nr:LuxR C-terminal-related transcriptional regulator [Yersinia wautersii]
MAICDPIDLHERSQAFHEEFFLHHFEHGNPWFIKDSELRYVAANRSFFELHGLSEQCSIFGKTDSELSSTLSYFVPKSSIYESVVIKEFKCIKTLEVNYFNSDGNLSIRLFNRKGFSFSSRNIGVITYIENAECLYFDTKVYDCKFSIERKNGSINIGRIVESYRNKSPGELLTDREWSIAWLILMGRCHDNISTILKLKKSHVTNVASEIYRKLGVPDRSVFIIAFKYCGWCNFIPQEILSEPESFIIQSV